jgi:membrane protein DedA with SNARE-associated domain
VGVVPGGHVTSGGMGVTYLADGGAGGGLAGVVADYATKVMGALGSPGAGLANMLDGIIPVLPSEVILPLAGFAAQRGELNLYAALVWTTIGSLAGALVMYYAGALLGRDRVRALAAKIPLVRASEIDRTEAWFQRHGAKTVLLGRMVPVFRSLISIPAGVERMPLPRFLLLTGVGSAVWNSVFVTAGYLLGDNWTLVDRYGGYLSKAVLALCALAVGYFVVSRLLRRRRERAEGDPTTETTPPPEPTGRVYYSSTYPGHPGRPDRDVP